MIFFCLSGGLITQSWERDPQAATFLVKRCLRIFPALGVTVVLTVFVLGPLFTTMGLREYFFDPTTWEYFRALILWPHHSWLPGVFKSNPCPSVVNASLWTLSPEFALYLSVLGAGLAGILQGRHTVSLIMLTLGTLTAAASFQHNTMVRDVSLLSFVFWSGAWLRINFQNGKPLEKIDLTLGLAALIIMGVAGHDLWAQTALVVLAGGLVWLASKVPFGDQITRRIGDLSYGVYIYAFPVQQSLIAAHGKETPSYGACLTASCAIIFALAFLSWHLVEKPFIRMKGRRIAAAKQVKT